MVLTDIAELATGFEGSTSEQRTHAMPRRLAQSKLAQPTLRVSPSHSPHLYSLPLRSRLLSSCEKKVEIDFRLRDAGRDLRAIPRATIDAFLTLAKCTVISTKHNDKFDSYLLSESSLFIYPTKIILKTCGTTMLLKSVGPILVRTQRQPQTANEDPLSCDLHPLTLNLSFACVFCSLGRRS